MPGGRPGGGGMGLASDMGAARNEFTYFFPNNQPNRPDFLV
jgi:hypothetical protein